MRGEYSIAELCRREKIAQSQYYSWSKDFMEAGKKRLAGDTQREARSDEVVEMRREMRDLKEVVSDLTLENRVLLENYFLPGDLEAQVDAFVGHYNHQRHHESLKNLTPADVYTGRGQTILLERAKIKTKTMKLRRLQHAKSAA